MRPDVTIGEIPNSIRVPKITITDSKSSNYSIRVLKITITESKSSNYSIRVP